MYFSLVLVVYTITTKKNIHNIRFECEYPVKFGRIFKLSTVFKKILKQSGECENNLKH
jgi:hypothetical protein